MDCAESIPLDVYRLESHRRTGIHGQAGGKIPVAETGHQRQHRTYGRGIAEPPDAGRRTD